nr:MAG TPA: hypothetical protein [Caudoviricetes sp.]
MIHFKKFLSSLNLSICINAYVYVACKISLISFSSKPIYRL